ncbi:MAG: hypothetical protein KAW67_04820 [Candidatus Eisenbacteria sp.]|nr:hypothetical protein [Candidatus Eisenbacteria bacterium]
MRAFVIVLVVAMLVLPATAELKIRELVVPPGEGGGGMRSNIPWAPDGSQWHNLYPEEIACTVQTQTGHDDTDGDGFMDECENIQIDGVWEHIEWAGPTIYLWKADTREQLIVEPVGLPGSRTEYHVVSLLYCALVDLPATLQVCDYVTILSGDFAGEWHVEEIRDNVHTNGGSPVEASTWSKIKSFFEGLF